MNHTTMNDTTMNDTTMARVRASSSASTTSPPHRHEFRPVWTLAAFALLTAAIMLASRNGQSLWLLAAGVIGPDLSFVAAIGAAPLERGLLAPRAVRPYNVVHTPVTPIAVGVVSLAAAAPALTVLAIAWLSHITWDRGLGYRLRNPDGSIKH